MRDNYNHGQIVLENAQNMITVKPAEQMSATPFPLSILENGKMQACAR